MHSLSTMFPESSQVTRGHSCLACQQRKVKCDGQRPCSTCLKKGEECTAGVMSRQSNRRKNKPRAATERLQLRLRHCEEALQAHGIKLDEDRLLTDKAPFGLLPTPSLSSPDGQMIVKRGEFRYVENSLWKGLTDELQDSGNPANDSDDESSQIMETRSVSGRFLLTADSRPAVLYTFHPAVTQLFQLWQVFLNNVDPIVKLFHAPSVQRMVLEAASDLASISRSTEALLFTIYLSAITSMDEESCQRVLYRSKSDLVVRFSKAAEQALVNADFLKSTNIVVLEALTLYLLATSRLNDPQTQWLFTGLANRIGQAMGLHREVSLSSFSAFEREMRRRLWWQILIMDSRSAQLSGVAVDAHSYLSWDTKRPLNLNDSDLSPLMRELPAEYKGPTEMLFCSIRFEIGDCMRQLKAIENDQPGASSAMRMAEEARAIDALETRLDQGYLRKCDSAIPLHLLATYLGRSSVCQLRLSTHHPQMYPDKGASLAQEERDRLFFLGLQVLTYDNLVYSNKSLAPYLWHVSINFPFEAFILILTELLTRNDCEIIDRAWTKVNQAYEDHPELITESRTNALFFAVGSLTLRAWELRVTATRNQQLLYQPVEPSSISELRALRRGSQVRSSMNAADGFNSTAPAGYLTTGDPVSLAETGPEGVVPVPADMSYMDWQYWQALLDGRVEHLNDRL